ncbi:MAG: sigma-70 family RNA polymerase sigma factor [Rhodothermales bacterium]|nr:sigma-70 family RNA polymerase sigma factor [Rhodothermales bacterium]
MSDSTRRQVTELLTAASDGDSDALDRLLPLLYSELHELAHRQRRRQSTSATLNTTALLHEAYEKMARVDGAYASRVHFFRVAAQAMRQILVDYARRYLAEKRGGGNRAGTFEEGVFAVEKRSEEILALDEALDELEEMSPRQAEVVKLRYYAGFSLEETADLMDLSASTVWREWAAARAWLQQELSSDPPE